MLKEPNAVSSDNKFVPQSFMLFFKKNSAVKHGQFPGILSQRKVKKGDRVKTSLTSLFWKATFCDQ